MTYPLVPLVSRCTRSSLFGRVLRSQAVGFLFLGALAAHAAPPAKPPSAAKPPAAGPSITLPHTGAYAYWIQSRLGAVSAMPITVSAPQITLPASDNNGDTLYVLDKDNGYVAALPLPKNPTKPLSLSVGDFRPITPAGASIVTSEAPSAPAPPRPAPEQDGVLAHLLTAFFGLLVAAGVVWIIAKLIQSRGRPLIAAARRFGVEVPDPEAASGSDPSTTQVYSPPGPRPVERIPDEAGVSPPPPRDTPARRAPMGTSGVPQIVGVQGIAAGSSFVVLPGEVVIGRDGDNGIVLAENTVSRRHARLLHDDTGRITLTDEGSANGVYVNGKRITQAVLAPGDQIQIGDSYFRLEG